MDDQTVEWLRGLAAKGGKGVVNNIDARCLGRIADELELLRRIAPCEYCGPNKGGMSAYACENCMNTGLKYPTVADLAGK